MKMPEWEKTERERERAGDRMKINASADGIKTKRKRKIEGQAAVHPFLASCFRSPGACSAAAVDPLWEV